jgi:hypothetical protein
LTFDGRSVKACDNHFGSAFGPGRHPRPTH